MAVVIEVADGNYLFLSMLCSAIATRPLILYPSKVELFSN